MLEHTNTFHLQTSASVLKHTSVLKKKTLYSKILYGQTNSLTLQHFIYRTFSFTFEEKNAQIHNILST